MRESHRLCLSANGLAIKDNRLQQHSIYHCSRYVLVAPDACVQFELIRRPPIKYTPLPNWSTSQIPQWLGQISHNALILTEMCTHFCFKMVQCEIWDWCIVECVQRVYFVYYCKHHGFHHRSRSILIISRSSLNLQQVMLTTWHGRTFRFNGLFLLGIPLTECQWGRLLIISMLLAWASVWENNNNNKKNKETKYIWVSTCNTRVSSKFPPHGI